MIDKWAPQRECSGKEKLRESVINGANNSTDVEPRETAA